MFANQQLLKKGDEIKTGIINMIGRYRASPNPVYIVHLTSYDREKPAHDQTDTTVHTSNLNKTEQRFLNI